MSNINIEVGDFLGFCDLNGIDALTSDQVERLESLVERCQKAQNEGESLVADAIYDRLIDILRTVVPDSELVTQIWEESTDFDFQDEDDLFRRNPMYSIQTVKSYDCKELSDFVKRLPEDIEFDAHLSLKENGFGIRLVYLNGDFYKARTRARASNGRDITEQLRYILETTTDCLHIEELEGFPVCEIRGELLLPYSNFDAVRGYNESVISPFSAVSSMSRDSASKEEWGLLRFVAYNLIADDFEFEAKDDMYSFIESLGFEVPASFLIEGLTKETFMDEIEGIVQDCEEAVEEYDYYTDGLVLELNNRDLFRSMGDNGSNYCYGNIALKVGFWQQNIYSGYVQTILWTKGKTKLSPVAIVADEPDIIEFSDLGDHMYIGDIKEIINFDEMGVVTSAGNKVKRVPLYEPSNVLMLDATKGNVLYFRYGGEAGVVPCFPNGVTLTDGRVQQELEYDEYAL